MNDLRIISFLPAATEMVFALGLGDALVGVSHECDFPTPAKKLPVVVKPVLPLEKMTLREIDTAVAARIGSGQNLYQVDEALLRELKPNLILTQNLCEVCGPAGNEITAALKCLQPKPQILWMTPHSLEDVFQNLRELGHATGRLEKAEALAASLRERLRNVAVRTKSVSRPPKVFCLEWTDPYYCCGHWVPEMIEIAGGEDPFGRPGGDSIRIELDDVREFGPEIVVVAPCGFGLAEARRFAGELVKIPNAAISPVDANAFFARPGPRYADGIALLQRLFEEVPTV